MKGESMTLDEAIKHCEEVTEEYGMIKSCKECAEEHRQLAEWLKELKMYREMIPSASEVFLDEIRSDKK
jgi:adenine C2-methylase RlmN of 23S rRNA A2503 and tRNA A37